LTMPSSDAQRSTRAASAPSLTQAGAWVGKVTLHSARKAEEMAWAGAAGGLDAALTEAEAVTEIAKQGGGNIPDVPDARDDIAEKTAISGLALEDGEKNPDHSPTLDMLAAAETEEIRQLGTDDDISLSPARQFPDGRAAVERFSKSLSPALAATVREMYNENQEPGAYLEDMMRAYKAGREGITDPREVFGPELENAHINLPQFEAARLAGWNEASAPAAESAKDTLRSAFEEGGIINKEVLKDPRTLEVVSQIFGKEGKGYGEVQGRKEAGVYGAHEGTQREAQVHDTGGTGGVRQGSGDVWRGVSSQGPYVAQDGRRGVIAPKVQADYLESQAKDYKDTTIEGYKRETGLEVVVASDEAWEAVFGPGSVKEQSAKSLGGKIYLPSDCSTWSDEALKLALNHEGTHAMGQLGFQPYLELLGDVGGYVDFGNPYMQNLLKELTRHVGISEETFFDDNTSREKVYDELCATLSGHLAIGQTEGTFAGERVKLAEFFRSEQEFNEFLDRLKGIQDEFSRKKDAADGKLATPDEQEAAAKEDKAGEKQELSSATAHGRLASEVIKFLQSGEELTSSKLFSIADKAYGGTMAQGTYTVKDAYDGMELAVNRYLMRAEFVKKANGDVPTAITTVKKLVEFLSKLPTQGNKRTEEMQSFQQFSTPPNIAYLAAWVANITKGDVILEPSAGIGGLALWGKAWGASVYGNELSSRRLELLKELGLDGVFNLNAEQIDNVLPDTIKPSVVIMNPPFSATAGRTSTNRTANAKRHIEQALERLEPGGRLVAILGKGMANDAASFRQWWNELRTQYSIPLNIRIDGENYRKYGTTWDVQLVVIDKTGPHTGTPTITGEYKDLNEIPKILEVVRNVRRVLDAGAGAEQNTAVAGVQSAGEKPVAQQPVSPASPEGSSGGMEAGGKSAGGAFPGQEAQDAVSILEAVSKGGAISPAGDGTGITDSGAIIPVAPADLPAGIAPDAQAALQRAAEEMYAPGETDTRAETPASTGEAGGKSGSNRDTYTVINRLKESIPELEQEQPVAQVSLAEIEAASGENMAERARKLFEKIKGVVTRQGFGEVEINSRSVKDDLSHGVGLAKAAVVPAIPSIIREGRQIDFQQNWKGRAYDGYVFAAPVTMDGETVYVAAVVKKSSKNRFYLHEVVDSNGNILKMNSGEGATQTSLATNGDAGTRSPLLSPTIAQTGDGVKGETGGVQAALEQAFSTLGEQGREQGMAFFDAESQDPASYYGGFAACYQAGLTGKELGKGTSPYAGALNSAQKQAAYLAGQMDAKAELTAGQEAAQFTRSAGEGSGLVYDEFVRQAVESGRKVNGKTYISKETCRRMNALAKALGVRVRFVDSVLGGKANAEINIPGSGHEVLIEKNNPNPIRALLGHELTHRIQQLDPAGYRVFRDYVGQLEETAARVEHILNLYSKHNVELSYEGALDEAAADYAGELFESSEILDRFIRENLEHRSLLEKVRDFFRDLAAKLTGKEKKQETQAEEKLTAALEAAVRQARETGDGKSTTTEGDGAQFSIKYDQNNNPYVVIETDILEGVPQERWVPEVRKNLKARFPKGIEVSGRNIKINAQTTSEITSSEYSKWLRDNSPEIYADKFRATDSVDEILLASRDYVGEGQKHPRKDNITEFARGTVQMRIGENDYTADVVVAVTKSGSMVLYDLVNILPTEIDAKKQIQAAATPMNGLSDRTPESVSNDSISRDGGEVNGKFSLKDPTDYEAEVKRIKRQAQRLQGKGGGDTMGKTSLKSLTEAEWGALLQYKSSESYKVNEKLRDGIALTEVEQTMVDELDCALEKLPVHEGTVCRRLSFELKGREALDIFLSEHAAGSIVPYKAYTSSSATIDGYTVSGKLIVTQIISGKTGRDMAGIGNNNESEILFARNTRFYVEKIEMDADGNPIIYMEEVAKHGAGQLYSEERLQAMQQMQTPAGENGELQTIPGLDTRQGADRGGVPGVREEGDEGVKLSLKDPTDYEAEVKRIKRQAQKESWSNERFRKELQNAVNRAYQELTDIYGAAPAGEKPARVVRVPRKTSDTEKVSRTVRTILEAKVTPEEVLPKLQELVARGEFSYETVTDREALERAESTITEKNWGLALAEWKKDMEAGKVSKDNTALGWALYNNAANSGNLDLAMDVLTQMVQSQRSAAQALQATRILKKLSPEGQLYGAVKSVESLQKELNERYGEKNTSELVIDEELGRRLLEAKTQQEREQALAEIYRDIGRQMPARFRDKWNAWRYLSMLGNPRTHVRNIMGNAGFAPLVLAKDLTATAIEKAVSALSGERLERSKALVGLGKEGRGLLTAAWTDYDNVAQEALGSGKYSDLQNANRYIEEGRVIFKGKNPASRGMEAARKANSKALDVEDAWFSRPHYAYALAQFCAARKITAAEIRKGNPQVLEAARSYAVKEAQKATYRDTNALSQTVSRLGRDMTGGKNPVSKGLGTVMEGILPFRKTPANILARGLEYSPLGLVKSLSYDLLQVQKGGMTGAEMIDNLSAGLTGTGLLLFGLFLAAQGLVRGRGEGDDKERELARLQGRQSYALELPDGKSITLDWLAPEALPFFVGVNLWEQAQDGDGKMTLSQMLEAIANVTEPMLEMSCLQSVNDALQAGSNAYARDGSVLSSVLAGAAASYLTQGLPTLFGQLERMSEQERESTYTQKDAFLTPDMQYTLGKVSGKVPGWEYQQIPYIDAWGRRESSGSVGQRAFNNLLNPAYLSQVEGSAMEEELLRLYRSTGEAGVLPQRAGKFFQVEGNNRYLTAQEYVTYAQDSGQKAFQLATALTQSPVYAGMEDGARVECLEDAYTYARQTARHSIDGRAGMDAWVVKAQEAEKRHHIPVETYILVRNSTQDISRLRDENGQSIPNSRGLLIMEEVYQVKGLNDEQRSYLFEALGVGKSVLHYNRAAVEQALEKMRRQGRG